MKRYLALLIIIQALVLCARDAENNTEESLPSKPTQLFGNHVWHASYQHQIVNGQVVAQGRVKNEEERYEVIKKILDQFDRPITMLDIGAAQGYYTFRAAYEMKDSVFVMIEEDLFLKKLCVLNTALDNIVFLQKRVTSDELKSLGECEHFDVVLALNVIHWSEANWRKMADAVMSLGDHFIIETPPAGDNAIGKKFLGDIEKYFEEKGARVLLKTPRHTGTGLLANLYYLQSPKKTLKRPFWQENTDTAIYEVDSNMQTKKFRKYSAEGVLLSERDWKPGMNLLSYQRLNGKYPLESTLQDRLDLCTHEAKERNNIIVQGNKVKVLEEGE